jgi:hypothetical protein
MNFWLTALAAFILMIAAAVCLLIGFLITGKVRLKKGTCGWRPKRKGDPDEEEGSCNLCGSKKSCDKDPDKR